MTKADKVRKFDIPTLDGWQYTRKPVTGYQVKEFAEALETATFEEIVLKSIDTFVDELYHRDGGVVDPLQEDWLEVVVPLGLSARNSTLPFQPGENSDES